MLHAVYRIAFVAWTASLGVLVPGAEVRIILDERFNIGYQLGPLNGQNGWVVDRSPFNVGSAQIEPGLKFRAPDDIPCEIQARQPLNLNSLKGTTLGMVTFGTSFLAKTEVSVEVEVEVEGTPQSLIINELGNPDALWDSWRHIQAGIPDDFDPKANSLLRLSFSGNGSGAFPRLGQPQRILLYERPKCLWVGIIFESFEQPKPLVGQVRSRSTGRVYSIKGLAVPGDFTFNTWGWLGLDAIPNDELGSKFDAWIKMEYYLGKRSNAPFVLTEGDSGFSWNELEEALRVGDVDGDNYIGTDDYLIVNNAFDSRVGEETFDQRADTNKDGYVGTDDYLMLNQNWDMEGDPPFEPY